MYDLERIWEGVGRSVQICLCCGIVFYTFFFFFACKEHWMGVQLRVIRGNTNQSEFAFLRNNEESRRRGMFFS